MNRAWSLALLATFAIPTMRSSAARPAATTTLRVLTYNIHHGEGTDGRFDLPRLAGVITSADPDLVALQEVDEGTARASGVHQLDELAQLTGMSATFGKAMDFQGGAYGVGVLSRQPVLKSDTHPLPTTPEREPRTALTVDVHVGDAGPLVQFTSTHFDQGRDLGNRTAQADALNQWLVREGERPGILAGDSNSRPDTPVLQILATRWIDAFVDHDAPDHDIVAPAVRPQTRADAQTRVDYVLVRPQARWRLVESKVVDAPVASDHEPVLAVLEWVDGP